MQTLTPSLLIVGYFISYISKAERNWPFAKKCTKASNEGNVSPKEALKRLGQVYLHSSDVSAQEAVYYLTNMHLKECSRKKVFVPVGNNIVKMSLPLTDHGMSIQARCG